MTGFVYQTYFDCKQHGSGLISPHQIVGVESSPKLVVGAVFFVFLFSESLSWLTQMLHGAGIFTYTYIWAIFGLMYVNIPYMEHLGNITPISLWPLRMFMIRIRYS
jgi:hypothetical protein